MPDGIEGGSSTFPSIASLLAMAIKEGASDITLAIGAPATLRHRGVLKRVKTPALTCDRMDELIGEIQSTWGLSRIGGEIGEQGACDFAIEQDGTRFRGQVFRSRPGPSVALRRLPKEFVPLEKLLLPPQFHALFERSRGLILVTGPTGSGKTTTLATLIKYLTERHARHVVTIEDPIEYVLDHGKGIMDQREIPTHAPSFTVALEQALREDPDVIMLGEMRKLETIEVALRAAETGHLVVATLHTSSAAKTVDRIVEVFPAEVREQIRVQLSLSLLGIVSQTLLPTADGRGILPASEVLIMNNSIAQHIRKGETHKIKSDLQVGGNAGMRDLDKHLFDLWKEKKIKKEEALEVAADPPELERKINFEELSDKK